MALSWDQNLLIALVVALFVGGAAGALGSFMVLRRMALVGDAFTHVALPGMGLGLLLHFNPFLGAFLTLFVAVVGIWWLKKETSLYFEALVGIFFTTSLAIGVLLVPDHELIEALFGDITKLQLLDGVMAIILAMIIFWGMRAIKSAFLLSTISEEVAQSAGISPSRTNFFYLLLVALVVALGVKFVGALLMGALVVIPASSAQNVAKSFSKFMWLSAFFGLFGAAMGVIGSALTAFPPGPLVVLSSGAIFIVTFIYKKL